MLENGNNSTARCPKLCCILEHKRGLLKDEERARFPFFGVNNVYSTFGRAERLDQRKCYWSNRKPIETHKVLLSRNNDKSIATAGKEQNQSEGE